MKRESGKVRLSSCVFIGAAALAAACSGNNTSSANGNDKTPNGGGTDAGAEGAAMGGPDAAHTTLYLVGDSTVAAFNDPYYYPRYGYGTQIGTYLDHNIAVNNLALSGRSSKSYIDPADNSNYATLTSSLKAGDYVMIGFLYKYEKAYT